ncbi:DUF3710 domain-containing protein [Actinotignum urinale]|uniref:DUF3710 domain-containing protein n=1 Tax=Actinotignum urinale TaxID=190146 RepID=UPI00370DCDB0
MGFFSRFSKKNQGSDENEEQVALESETSESIETVKKHGPWDESEIADIPNLIDAGALHIPDVDNATIQFSVDYEQEVVLGVVYDYGDSAIQIQVFAAPKSANLWDEIRGDVITSVAQQGGRFSEDEGDFGTEIRAVMPAEHGATSVRFLGFDGPRWLLRVAVTGKAAVDFENGNALIQNLLDQIVVVRGQVPKLPRELISLTLPHLGEADEEEEASLDLPQRGPEIKEVH